MSVPHNHECEEIFIYNDSKKKKKNDESIRQSLII